MAAITLGNGDFRTISFTITLTREAPDASSIETSEYRYCEVCNYNVNITHAIKQEDDDRARCPWCEEVLTEFMAPKDTLEPRNIDIRFEVHWS